MTPPSFDQLHFINTCHPGYISQSQTLQGWHLSLPSYQQRVIFLASVILLVDVPAAVAKIRWFRDGGADPLRAPVAIEGVALRWSLTSQLFGQRATDLLWDRLWSPQDLLGSEQLETMSFKSCKGSCWVYDIGITFPFLWDGAAACVIKVSSLGSCNAHCAISAATSATSPAQAAEAPLSQNQKSAPRLDAKGSW